MSNSISIERNVAALRRSLSVGDFATITGAKPDGFELLLSDAASGPNIVAGGRHIYEPDARGHADRQVAAYLANPKRLSLNPAPPTSRRAFSEMAVARLYDRFAPMLVRNDRDPSLDAGYLVSLGLGLGLHLPALIDRLPVRNLIVVEQFPAIVRLSLTSVDWAGLIEVLERRGGGLHLLMSDNPQAVTASLYETMRGPDMALLDGSYIFPHYATAFLNDVAEALSTALPTIGDPVGFLEDEALMVRNAAANLARGIDGVVRQGAGDVSAPPAIVVGSGPSIDSQIDTIRNLRDDALVISGGTGLSVLLEHGIEPDLHCEIENVPDIHDAVAQCAARHDISNVILVGSVTVDPRMPPYFGRFLGVFRDVLSSTRLLSAGHAPLEMAGPTVTNLACRTAIAAGCREIYLFGVDLGSVDPAKHHSDGSLYAYSEDSYWRSGAQMEPLAIQTPGNFRDTVYTSREFLFTKLYFDTLTQTYPDTAFYNCSDGARIAGARPLRGETLALPALKPGAIPDAIARLSVAMETGQDTGDILRAARAAVLSAMDRLLDALANIGPDADFTRLHVTILPFLKDRASADEDSVESVAGFMLSGSLMTMLLACNSLVGRIAPENASTVVAETAAEMRTFASRVGELFDRDP